MVVSERHSAHQRRCKERFEEVGCVRFVAGKKVSVAVEGGCDGGVAHVGGEG